MKSLEELYDKEYLVDNNKVVKIKKIDSIKQNQYNTNTIQENTDSGQENNLKKNWKYIVGVGIGIGIIILLTKSGKATSPVQKYKCSGSPEYICSPDITGTYNTLDECQYTCKEGLNLRECGKYAYIRVSDYFAVHNNTWGLCSTETGNEFCIYQNQKDTDYGWSWKRPNPQKCADPDCHGWVCPTMQMIIIGDMWNDKMARGPHTSIFPYVNADNNGNAIGIDVDDINSWTASVDFTWLINPCPNPPCTIGINNIWANFAYDIYIMDNLGNKKENFMVWIYTSDVDSYSGQSFNDGINEYTYISKDENPGPNQWSWQAFVMKNTNTSINTHTVDLKKMLDFIRQKKGYANWNNWRIYGHSLGCEVAGGEGKINITRFKETLNGVSLGR